jgi:hypothetical protein
MVNRALTIKRRGHALPRLSVGKIVQKLGGWLDPPYEKMIASASASDVEQMPLAVVDFLQAGIVGDVLDPLLRRDYLVVACHHHDSAEFQPLRQVHRADREAIRRDFYAIAQFDHRHAGSFDRAVLARRSSRGERTRTAISWAGTPCPIRAATHSPTASDSCSGSSKVPNVPTQSRISAAHPP